MSIMKKIAVAVFAASLFILSSCKETEEIKIADVSATVGGSHFFNKKAVAKVSDDADKGESKITAIFGNDEWYSTTCKVVIHGQENGAKLSLINGSFEATVYKSATESKTISGTISNVVGLN